MGRLTRSLLGRARIAAGFATAQAAAERVVCSRQYLLMIEAGRAVPSAALLKRIAFAYQMTPDQVSSMIQSGRTELLRRQLTHTRASA